MREGVSCSGPISGPTIRRFVARPSNSFDPAAFRSASGYDAFRGTQSNRRLLLLSTVSATRARDEVYLCTYRGTEESAVGISAGANGEPGKSSNLVQKQPSYNSKKDRGRNSRIPICYPVRGDVRPSWRVSGTARGGEGSAYVRCNAASDRDGQRLHAPGSVHRANRRVSRVFPFRTPRRSPPARRRKSEDPTDATV
jgi:hypothetical protein